MPGPKGEKCSECYWADPSRSDRVVYACHAAPMLVDADDDAYWPTVQPGDWCRHFRSRMNAFARGGNNAK